MNRAVHVRAPSRLHFGMFGFGRPSGPQWGGVGVMVEPPTVHVTIEPATQNFFAGTHASRAQQFAQAAIHHWQISNPPTVRIDVKSPPDHTGLGVGTQLGLSIAAGLRRFLDLPDLPIAELAASVGRGRRSAVGTYGFRHGGFIIDAGKEAGLPLGALRERVDVPDEWRFVLVTPQGQTGLGGDVEADAFARLPPVPAEVTQELWRLADDDMLSALQRADCAAFGEAVYHFGRFAGECFAAVQGGPFASEAIGQLVDALRDHGVNGVGQSSWGPTAFAIAPNEADARALADWLHTKRRLARDAITIARANNWGAVIR